MQVLIIIQVRSYTISRDVHNDPFGFNFLWLAELLCVWVWRYIVTNEDYIYHLSEHQYLMHAAHFNSSGKP